MSKPPAQLDGADVLYWAWSEDEPFGCIPYTDGDIAAVIHGLAVCRYEDSGKVYQFRCNREWDVEGDSDYDSVDDAKQNIPDQYRNAAIQWNDYTAE